MTHDNTSPKTVPEGPFSVESPRLLGPCTHPENWRAFKAFIAAQCNGALICVLSAFPAPFHFGQNNHTPQFLLKFSARV